ncbi:MAG: ABC transporter substrate-binding protein [Acidimicrobiia bacterium]
MSGRSRASRRAQATPHAPNRRQFLGRAGLVAGGVALTPTVLAACGGDDGGSSSGGGGDNALEISNWPLYIDGDTVPNFEQKTGIDVTYKEDINDNNELFAKIQEPLANGDSIGADIIVPTGWLATRLIDLGYVQKLPLDKVPNARNVVPRLQDPAWDPTNEYTLPWQSGIGVIAYNIAETGRELRDFDDLLDPDFAGRVGMLLEMRDTLGLALLAEGVDITTVTFDQAQDAFDKIERAANDGQIRRFTGNNYASDLLNGNFVANTAWSGDVAQLAQQNPNLRVVIPESGGTLWADTMVWVSPSDREDAVAEWMNYVYDPENYAPITSKVSYLPVVDGVQEVLEGTDPEAAENPLVFPPPDVEDRLFQFKTLDEDEEAEFDERWAEVTGQA